MEVINEYPPNYKKIKEKFPNLEERKPIFSYGGKIYNPFEVEVTPDLQVHEQVHKAQQEKMKNWWDKYLEDDNFRLTQEVEAYGAQYKLIKDMMPVRVSSWFLDKFAEALSSHLYGNIISHSQAHTKLRHSVKQLS